MTSKNLVCLVGKQTKSDIKINEMFSKFSQRKHC